jgi:hypothetical protein
MTHSQPGETLPTDGETSAFSIVELTVVIFVIALLVALLWPGFRDRHGPPAGVNCAGNLKEVGLSFRAFANDHDGKLPMQLPVSNAPTALSNVGEPASYFLVATGELSTPLVLTCPADTRSRVSHWENLRNEHVSYFLSLDAALTMSNAILAGDRNILVSGRPVGSSVLNLTKNTAISWSGAMHSKAFGSPCGNLLFTDGSVATVKSRREANSWAAKRYPLDASVRYDLQTDLPHAVRNQELLTNRLSIP